MYNNKEIVFVVIFPCDINVIGETVHTDQIHLPAATQRLKVTNNTKKQSSGMILYVVLIIDIIDILISIINKNLF